MTQPQNSYIPPEGTWVADVLCAEIDPELFFPKAGSYVTSRTARQICRRCPVTAECLAHALAYDERFGVWGGLTAHERHTRTQGHRKATS